MENHGYCQYCAYYQENSDGRCSNKESDNYSDTGLKPSDGCSAFECDTPIKCHTNTVWVLLNDFKVQGIFSTEEKVKTAYKKKKKEEPLISYDYEEWTLNEVHYNNRETKNENR